MSGDIKSPCIKVCKYDEDKICIGCHRSMDEITGWIFMDNDQKVKTLQLSEQRKNTPRPGKNDYDYYV